jgi:ribosomal protein S18 acetylase RimI-like enzyme
MATIEVHPIQAEDRPWIASRTRAQWGGETVVAHGVCYVPRELPGYVALVAGERAGWVTYQIDRQACEIVALESLRRNRGIGTLLIEAVAAMARHAGCRRVWLITTNDNLRALGFYQKRGFAITAVYPNALERSRQLKPEIPLVGQDGIPLRDEIELERVLGSGEVTGT